MLQACKHPFSIRLSVADDLKCFFDFDFYAVVGGWVMKYGFKPYLPEVATFEMRALRIFFMLCFCECLSLLSAVILIKVLNSHRQ